MGINQFRNVGTENKSGRRMKWLKCDKQLNYGKECPREIRTLGVVLEKGQVNQVASCRPMHFLSYFRCNFAWRNSEVLLYF